MISFEQQHPEKKWKIVGGSTLFAGFPYIFLSLEKICFSDGIIPYERSLKVKCRHTHTFTQPYTRAHTQTENQEQFTHCSCQGNIYFVPHKRYQNVQMFQVRTYFCFLISTGDDAHFSGSDRRDQRVQRGAHGVRPVRPRPRQVRRLHRSV